jgi:hypothetical protein
MLRELRKYFKGEFESDLGKNRYFKHSGPKRHGVEAACYVASFRFLNSIQSLVGLNNWVLGKAQPKRKKAYIFTMDPAILTANLGTIHLVSLIEEFFKSIFVETLRSFKDVVNRNRFKPVKSFLLERAYQDELSLEQAVAESLSFQNAESIRRNFSGLPRVGLAIGI